MPRRQGDRRQGQRRTPLIYYRGFWLRQIALEMITKSPDRSKIIGQARHPRSRTLPRCSLSLCSASLSFKSYLFLWASFACLFFFSSISLAACFLSSCSLSLCIAVVDGHGRCICFLHPASASCRAPPGLGAQRRCYTPNGPRAPAPLRDAVTRVATAWHAVAAVAPAPYDLHGRHVGAIRTARLRGH